MPRSNVIIVNAENLLSRNSNINCRNNFLNLWFWSLICSKKFLTLQISRIIWVENLKKYYYNIRMSKNFPAVLWLWLRPQKGNISSQIQEINQLDFRISQTAFTMSYLTQQPYMSPLCICWRQEWIERSSLWWIFFQRNKKITFFFQKPSERMYSLKMEEVSERGVDWHFYPGLGI